MYTIEEEALEAYENGDEQKCFDLYMDLIEQIDEDDLDSDQCISFELISCYADYPNFNRYNGFKSIKFRTRVDAFFTEKHQKELKDFIEEQLWSLYEGAYDAWDMAKHPYNY